MAHLRLITLLTDFGLQDVYVGVMKGVIAQINPRLQVIDLTHAIPPQDLVAARFCLMNAYSYFPPETVHCVVVDPGVGSSRRGVAVQFAEGFLVAPDNGVLSGVLGLCPAIAAVELTNTSYWRDASVSTTFHGRDIFAPVAAHLASGVPLEEFGKLINPDSLVQLPFPDYEQTNNKIRGCIQYIDHFGNLITNIPARAVAGKEWSVVLGNTWILRSDTYSDRALQEVVTLIGSHGWVEIAVNQGNAQSYLGLEVGSLVEIALEP